MNEKLLITIFNNFLGKTKEKIWYKDIETNGFNIYSNHKNIYITYDSNYTIKIKNNVLYVIDETVDCPYSLKTIKIENIKGIKVYKEITKIIYKYEIF